MGDTVKSTKEPVAPHVLEIDLRHVELLGLTAYIEPGHLK